jgi:hypothetical protein
MLHEGVKYSDGQLVHCSEGHIAMVSCCTESGPYVGEAEPASEWVMRVVHAFHDNDRRKDARTMAAAVRCLEARATQAGEERGDER